VEAEVGRGKEGRERIRYSAGREGQARGQGVWGGHYCGLQAVGFRLEASGTLQ
jgi:hypothetical protein